MKRKSSLLSLKVFVFAIMALIYSPGCGKKEPAPQSSEKTKGARGASEARTSFEAVTAHLDPGGDLYVYVGTEQCLKGLSGKVVEWRQFFESIPDLNTENRQHINQAIDIATNVIHTSGIEDLRGLGLSSVRREDGLQHSKALLYHAPAAGSGFLWNFLGREPHELAGLSLLPADTVLATFSDFDMPLAWSLLHKQMTQSGLPHAEEALEKLSREFEKATGLNWEKVLNSFAGEYGIALTLDEARTMSLPLPQNQQLEIPEPALMFLAKVKDDTLFERIDEAIRKSGQQSFASSRPGLRMRTLPVPLPLPMQLGFTVAQSKDYLFIATSDLIIQKAMAVRAGEKPGLKSTEEFKRLSKDIPQQGNHFSFVSERFGKTINRTQRRALDLAGSAGSGGVSRQQQQALESLLSSGQPSSSYSVGTHTPEGWMFVANGNQTLGRFLLGSVTARAGILAGVALPNFFKAREGAQRQACAANLRTIEAAKRQWAIDNENKTEAPKQGDLLPFLPNRHFPVCPAGGQYTINEVSQPAQCSMHSNRRDG